MSFVPLRRLDLLPASIRTLRWAASFLTSAALLATASCGGGGDPLKQAPQRPPAQVTVATALTRDVPVYLDEIGKTVAVEVVSIVPQVGGKLVAAHVQDGDSVTKGQLLFEIDPRPFEASLAAARASLAQSKADRELADIEFKRTQDLSSKGTASQMEYDQDRVALAVTEAKVAAAEAAVETAELNLEYTQIRSPIDGRAGARLVDPGNVVKADDAPLQMVRRLDPIYAEFTITENDLGTVRKFMAARGLEWGASPERGLRVEVDVPGTSARVLEALGPAEPTSTPATGKAGPREGELTFLDNSVQSTTGTVRLRATVANNDHYFWPGQFVSVRLILTVKKDAVLVPVDAQQIGQQGPYVYVITPDSTAELRPIVPGQRQGGLLVVERGVQGGDQVVVTGQMAVMPGAKVQVSNGAPNGAPPGAPAQAAALAAE
jgi:membrane fusion protein, multidrug efflux system